MPDDVWNEVRQMLLAAGLVAAATVPLLVIAGVRRRGGVLPPWRPWRVPWGGAEAAAAFLILVVVVPELVRLGLSEAGFYRAVYGERFPGGPVDRPPPPSEATAAVAGGAVAAAVREQRETGEVLRRLWAGLFALPVQLGLLTATRRSLYPRWHPPSPPPLGPRLVLGILAWLILTPAVLLLNLGVNLVCVLFEVIPDAHQLTRLGGRPPLDAALFLLQAALAAPLLEEVLFRGVLLPWLLGDRRKAGDLPSSARVGLVLGVALLFTASTGRSGPVVFLLVLAGGWLATRIVCKAKRRTAGAVYSSAALFAAVHAAVWPSPIPLFVLGLGLGWLAVRTRGVFVPVVVHGLFNAVSAVYVLRGGAV